VKISSGFSLGFIFLMRRILRTGYLRVICHLADGLIAVSAGGGNIELPKRAGHVASHGNCGAVGSQAVEISMQRDRSISMSNSMSKITLFRSIFLQAFDLPEDINRRRRKTTRVGLRKCYACRKPFTVRVGTVFQDSHLPLRLWLQAIHLLCSSKKGISTRQLQRILGCGIKTAWHLGHRIRFAMAPGGDLEPLGGAGKVVEADETELARSRKTKRPADFRRKTHNPIVMSLVERGGDIRSTMLDHRTAMGVVRKNVHPDR
jgi:hypothetical protein